MLRRHYTFRRLTRSTIRRTVHPPFRLRWRSPDDLACAMGCFRRAIRAHRRLARLAPHQFDAAVTDRDWRIRQERRDWMASWQPTLEKVYGPPTPAERQRQLDEEFLADQPPPLHPRTRQAVEREYASWQFWMQAGGQAWVRYQQRRPHAIPSLGRVARLLEIAMDFGALATGLDSRQSPAPAAPEFAPRDVEADLQRIYGNPIRNTESTSASAAPAGIGSTADPSQRALESGRDVVTTTGRVPDTSAQIAKPASPPNRRRDAWQAWARQQWRSTVEPGR